MATRAISNDATLTGRTLIWDFVHDSIAERPLLGFGWSAFWDDPANRAPFLERIARERPEWSDDLAALNSAHSTFMATWLCLGVVGLALVLAVVVLSMGGIWWEALGSTSTSMGWWAAVGTFALVENATESMIVFNPVFWLFAPGPRLRRHSPRRDGRHPGTDRHGPFTEAVMVARSFVVRARPLVRRCGGLGSSCLHRDDVQPQRHGVGALEQRLARVRPVNGAAPISTAIRWEAAYSVSITNSWWHGLLHRAPDMSPIR